MRKVLAKWLPPARVPSFTLKKPNMLFTNLTPMLRRLRAGRLRGDQQPVSGSLMSVCLQHAYRAACYSYPRYGVKAAEMAPWKAVRAAVSAASASLAAAAAARGESFSRSRALNKCS